MLGDPDAVQPLRAARGAARAAGDEWCRVHYCGGRWHAHGRRAPMCASHPVFLNSPHFGVCVTRCTYNGVRKRRTAGMRSHAQGRVPDAL
eukprot:2334095-Prymnesium_polylepis.1